MCSFADRAFFFVRICSRSIRACAVRLQSHVISRKTICTNKAKALETLCACARDLNGDTAFLRVQSFLLPITPAVSSLCTSPACHIRMINAMLMSQNTILISFPAFSAWQNTLYKKVS